jgi:TRAP-type C4-dicarboxylate transport system substrate-binding protein
MAFAELAGKMWDEQAIAVEEAVRKRGNTVTELSKEESARWQKATQPVVDNWLKQAKDKGLNGEKLLADARAAIAKYSKS